MGRKQCNIQGDKVRQAVESMECSCRGRQSSDYKRQEGRQLGFKERLGKVGQEENKSSCVVRIGLRS